MISTPTRQRTTDAPRVAIVHDYLVECGGAERVALELLNEFPDAPIYTVLYWPSKTYSEFRHADVRPLLGAGSVSPEKSHRMTLPAAVAGLASKRLRYDLVISSSSGLGHLARNRTGPQLVYCHTPARWLHRPDNYFRGMDPGLRRSIATVAPAIGRLDRRRMQAANQVIVNSRVIRNEVERIYGIKAGVVHPVSALEPHGPETELDIAPGFYLTPSRLLGYKRIDLIIETARRLPNDHFVIVGDGPGRSALTAGAPPNVTFLGVRTDAELRWLYRNSARVILTCAEDYGLVPAEAAAFGIHSVVPDARGFRDVDGGHESILPYAFGDVTDLIRALAETTGPSQIAPDLEVLQKDFRRQIRSAADALLQGALR